MAAFKTTAVVKNPFILKILSWRTSKHFLHKHANQDYTFQRLKLNCSTLEKIFSLPQIRKISKELMFPTQTKHIKTQWSLPTFKQTVEFLFFYVNGCKTWYGYSVRTNQIELSRLSQMTLIKIRFQVALSQNGHSFYPF